VIVAVGINTDVLAGAGVVVLIWTAGVVGVTRFILAQPDINNTRSENKLFAEFLLAIRTVCL
jgi:hypothetical protein